MTDPERLDDWIVFLAVVIGTAAFLFAVFALR